MLLLQRNDLPAIGCVVSLVQVVMLATLAVHLPLMTETPSTVLAD
jgi:hypothetical protein